MFLLLCNWVNNEQIRAIHIASSYTSVILYAEYIQNSHLEIHDALLLTTVTKNVYFKNVPDRSLHFSRLLCF